MSLNLLDLGSEICGAMASRKAHADEAASSSDYMRNKNNADSYSGTALMRSVEGGTL